jgi:hypothetical protein
MPGNLLNPLNFVAYSACSGAELQPGCKPGTTAMMMRSDFQVQGCKPMNVNELDPRIVPLRRPSPRPGSGPGLLTMCLGAACVAGMFGLLGLLYAIG